MSVTPGICTMPAITDSTASGAIAAFIGHSRSAMWCSAPGKPTSVSSGSPVAGLAWLAVGEVALLELARLRRRLAEEDPEDHPERVEGGQQRGDVADHASTM